MTEINASRYEERRSRFPRFRDPGADRLVYVGAAADADFWDRRWMDGDRAAYGGSISPRGLVVRETRRFLAAGSLVLEGGCGLAVDSWRLHQLGYRTLALDYALRTLFYVGRRAPEVRPLAGDVTRLPLPDASVDGYWSLGVIEHFYRGYAGIQDEMRRVLRPGGYLFLTFPSMNRLRRTKARLGLYPEWRPSADELGRFYQFALPADDVARGFEAAGFERVRSVSFLGVTGLCEELGALGMRLDRLLSGRSRPVRLLRAALDLVVRPLSHHSRLLVLRRETVSSGGAAPTTRPPEGG